jgi:hypothetical protein
MAKMKIPQFQNWEEEAEWWDKTDTSEWMDDLRPIKPGTIVPVDNRCRKCGGKAKMERGDWRIPDGKITLHDVKLYRCVKCGAVHPAWEVQQTARQLQKFMEEIRATMNGSKTKAVKTARARTKLSPRREKVVA